MNSTFNFELNFFKLPEIPRQFISPPLQHSVAMTVWRMKDSRNSLMSLFESTW